MVKNSAPIEEKKFSSQKHFLCRKTFLKQFPWNDKKNSHNKKQLRENLFLMKSAPLLKNIFLFEKYFSLMKMPRKSW